MHQWRLQTNHSLFGLLVCRSELHAALMCDAGPKPYREPVYPIGRASGCSAALACLQLPGMDALLYSKLGVLKHMPQGSMPLELIMSGRV